MGAAGLDLRGKRILVVDDHEALRRMLTDYLARLGATMSAASGGREALALMERETHDLVLLDLRMDDMDGLEVLQRAAGRAVVGPSGGPRRFVMMSAEGTVPAAVEALRLGAADFLVKPFELHTLIDAVRRLVAAPERADRQRDPRAAWRDEHAPGLIGEHDALLSTFFILERIAATDVTVLLLGDSGTGKELVARGIHHASNRTRGAFVPVNCGAIPESLIESELFGHVKGAFSGAIAAREGRFAAADHGTLFLDEIGEMSLQVQVKFLRVLQEGEYVPVGETRARTADVRVIAATHRDLESMVAEGKFREDLFYRLNLIPIRLPPLRERGEDVLMLARHFLRVAHERRGGPTLRLSDEVSAAFLAHPWPGNVRELENLIERLALLHAGTGTLELSELPPAFRRGGSSGPHPSASDSGLGGSAGLASPDTRSAGGEGLAPNTGEPGAAEPLGAAGGAVDVRDASPGLGHGGWTHDAPPPPGSVASPLGPRGAGSGPSGAGSGPSGAGSGPSGVAAGSGGAADRVRVQEGLAQASIHDAAFDHPRGDGWSPAPGATESAKTAEVGPEDIRLPADGLDLRKVVEALEASLIEQALARTSGNRNQAARLLGLNRTTLVEKLRKLARLGAAGEPVPGDSAQDDD